MGLTHLDAAGRAQMVDVGAKPLTDRVASASGRIVLSAATLEQIMAGGVPKGDVLAAARIAGIQAAKQTSALIPLCHPLALTRIDVAFDAEAATGGASAALRVTATAAAHGPTGVEMEALTAVSVALLTIYDMAKGVERGMVLTDIGLLAKTGGRNGPWHREPGDPDRGTSIADPPDPPDPSSRCDPARLPDLPGTSDRSERHGPS